MGATTFVDHVSDYVYVHLMRDLTLDETLLAKEAMEKVMAQAGRNIKHYHADNGRFADNGFIDAVNSKVQNITFCGAGAHTKIVLLKVTYVLWLKKLVQFYRMLTPGGLT